MAKQADRAKGGEAKVAQLTKGQRDAIRMIAAGSGCFHKSVGIAIERAGYAYPVSGLVNFLVGSNERSANGWRLTDLGAAIAA